MKIIHAALESKKIIWIDEGEEYKSLGDALRVNSESKQTN